MKLAPGPKRHPVVVVRLGGRDGARGGSCAVDPAVAATHVGAIAARWWCGVRGRRARRPRRSELVNSGEPVERRSRVVSAGSAFVFFKLQEAGIAPELDAPARADHCIAAVPMFSGAVGVEMEFLGAVEARRDESQVVRRVAADVALPRLLGGHGWLLVPRCCSITSARAWLGLPRVPR